MSSSLKLLYITYKTIVNQGGADPMIHKLRIVFR